MTNLLTETLRYVSVIRIANVTSFETQTYVEQINVYLSDLYWESLLVEH